MAIIVILCGAPHLYKKDMNNSGLFTKIKGIEETCEGIENENNAQTVSELNMRQVKLSAEKTNLTSKLSSLEYKLNLINEEIRSLSGTGIERILKGIKKTTLIFL